MNLSRDEIRKLALPAAIAVALLAAGAALIWFAGEARRGAQQELAKAREDHKQTAEKLARIAEEEREVNQKIQVYRQLRQLNILGDEKRLEWADAMTRIRAQRELLDLRYRVDRQRRLASFPAKPGTVDINASTMKVDLALLHEEDLLRFLDDLRDSGNAYFAPRRCSVSRTGQAATGAAIMPRLRAECEIDLITVQDGGAKP